MAGKDTWTARWIWHQALPQASELARTAICYFRRSFDLSRKDCSLKVRVSAENRYRLYVNGKTVNSGPCRTGSIYERYYDELDLSPFLLKGKNVISAVVVHYPDLEPIGYFGAPVGILRSPTAAFLLQGTVKNGTRTLETLDSDPVWRCRPDDATTLVHPNYVLCVGENEDVAGSKVPHGWTLPGFDDSSWSPAVAIWRAGNVEEQMMYDFDPFTHLKPRPIPLLFETPRKFLRIMRTNLLNPALNRVLTGYDGKAILQPGARVSIELDAGELTTAYVEFGVSGGRNAVIRITYAECYLKSDSSRDKTGRAPRLFKEKRDDPKDAVIMGESDVYRPGGADESYEPFLWRTFRFVKLDIQVDSEPLTVTHFRYRETGYPLAGPGKFRCSDKTFNKMWDVSRRTLQRCMHETHEDCPYYEQLSYGMDSRLQMLYSYQLFADDRMARRTIADLDATRLPCGLTMSRAPTSAYQVIPGFSLHWILMIADHYRYFGDIALVRQYRPTMDSVLGWFDRQVDEHGLIGKHYFWPFFDWVSEWVHKDNKPGGVPPAAAKGPATVYSLFYAYVLKQAAVLMDASGREALGEEYRQRSAALLSAVQKYCFDSATGYYKDGPAVRTFSQHVQVWAVLSGLVTGARAIPLLKKALADKKIAKMAWASAHFFFRAFRVAGDYGAAWNLWELWKKLLDMNVTTWPEDPVNLRSECHAWGSNPLFEAAAEILGVQPELPGYGKARIVPQVSRINSAEGVVATCRGPIKVNWTKRGRDFRLTVSLPRGVPASLILPDGTTCEMQAGRTASFSCRL